MRTLRNLASDISKVKSAEVARIEDMKNRVLEEFDRINKALKKGKMFVIDGDKSDRQIVTFVPNVFTSSNLDNFSRNEISKRSRQASMLGMGKFDEYYLSKVKELSDQYWEATHQESTIDGGKRADIVQEYGHLKSIIEKLLETELKRDIDGNPTLFDISVSQGVLSQGQNALLQFAVALHCQKSKLDELILILDEPESHLHPAAIIEVIETLVKSVPNGQIWIATHAIPILAHFHKEASLWYIRRFMVHARIAGSTAIMI